MCDAPTCDSFGGSFNLLRDGDKDGLLRKMESSLVYVTKAGSDLPHL